MTPHHTPGTHDAGSHAHRHDHHHGNGHDDEAFARMLDLEGEVMREYLDEVTAWVRETAEPPCDRFLDLGAGTGTGTFALLDRFPGAVVTSVDVSTAMADRVRAKAEARGVGDRVRTVTADLDAPWPDLGPVDVVWAAASLHHLADPAEALRRMSEVLRPGGLLVLTEIDDFPTFLPGGSEGAEAEAQAAAAAARMRAEQLPHLGADWTGLIEGAGLTVLGHREFAVTLEPPVRPLVREFAQASFRRLVDRLADTAPADLVAALGRLAEDHGPGSVLERDDLVVRTRRTGWLARRP